MSEMLGYDKEKAYKFILSSVDENRHKALKSKLPRLLKRMIDLDIEAMHDSGALDENGDTGEGVYDEDDAFEQVLDKLSVEEHATEAGGLLLAMLLNDFYRAQSAFLEQEGLSVAGED